MIDSDRAPTFPERTGRALDGLAEPFFWAVVVARILGNRTLGETPVLLGDALLAAALLVFSLDRLHSTASGFRPAHVAGGLFVLVAASVSTLANMIRPGFDALEAIGAFAKLSLYLAVCVALPSAVYRVGPERVARWLGLANLFIALFLTAELILFLLGITVPNLEPYAFSEFDRAAFPRFDGPFTEPATLGLFVATSMVYAAYARLYSLSFFGVCLYCLMLSASLVGVLAASAAVAVLLVAVRSGSQDWTISTPTPRPLLIGLTTAGGFLFLLPGFRTLFSNRVTDRISGTLAGTDGSGRARVVDSWVAAVDVAGDHPVFGLGAGQFAVELSSLAHSVVGFDPRLITAGGGWNVFANCSADMGIVGFATLLASLFLFSDKRFPLIGFLVLVGFATGGFYAISWWYSVAIAAAVPNALFMRAHHEHHEWGPIC